MIDKTSSKDYLICSEVFGKCCTECITCVNTTINHILSYRNEDTNTSISDTLSSYTKATTPAMADNIVATAAEWPIVMALLSADSALATTGLAPKPPSPAGKIKNTQRPRTPQLSPTTLPHDYTPRLLVVVPHLV
ncbi:hypothetical protein ACHAXM_000817 [Skeletonema potamos]